MRWKVHKRTSEDLLEHLFKLRKIQDSEKFLNPPHPSALTAADVSLDKKELTAASDRIKKAVEKEEKIVVYGDYDVDGVAGTAILWETLNSLGAKVMPYLPDRKTEGYGFTPEGTKRVMEKHEPSLIVSVDHGITAAAELIELTDSGVDVIVTDHHQPPQEEKLAKIQEVTKALIHTTELSGSGVAYYLAGYLSDTDDADRLGLAAFGTIADIVPLLSANRSIAKYGLPALSKAQKAGIRALLEEAGIYGQELETYHIGYILGPRINAAGRIDHALSALRLLCTNDPAAAEDLASRLGSLNRQRQQLLQKQLEYCFKQIPRGRKLPPLLILADPTFEEGIIGLLAGKLTERYNRPAIVVAQGERISKASARSVPGINIIELIREVEDLLLSAGGHPLAAGFSIETDTLAQAADELLRISGEKIVAENLTREIEIEAELKFDEINRELFDKLERFNPFGEGNRRPLFVTREQFLEGVRPVGKDNKHLKFKVNGMDAIAFGRGYMLDKLDLTRPADLAYSLNLNRWNEREILQLKIRDIKQP